MAPESWHGGLPFAYHIGPGKARVHLKVAFNWDQVPCYDVIAKIPGEKFPDEWVIRGNHQDAWVNGAADPVSGLAPLLEEAKSMGALLKTGWEPDRTIVYCVWDGEEPGLLGSTEWVEDHEKELKDKAVVYINSDGNGRGFLYAEGSHALEPLLDEVSKNVADPETHVSVFERRKAHRIITTNDLAEKEKIWDENELKIGAMGSGSDYSSFLQHEGIPSLNLGFGGENEGGEYHSIYDSYDMYIRFKDPGFHYGVALAETAGHVVLRMSEADGLPFDFTHLYKTVKTYVNELTGLMSHMREETALENKIFYSGYYRIGEDPTKGYKIRDPETEVPYLDFSPLENALTHLEKSVDTLDTVYREKLKSNEVDDVFNQALYRAEQQLLNRKRTAPKGMV